MGKHRALLSAFPAAVNGISSLNQSSRQQATVRLRRIRPSGITSIYYSHANSAASSEERTRCFGSIDYREKAFLTRVIIYMSLIRLCIGFDLIETSFSERQV
jgi:hypothetical protein